MEYADVLAGMIAASGKTLREIADLCRELGVKIDPSYLSRLQTGKQAPASDEVNAAIARVCKKKPEELLLASYSEKAPEFVQTFVAGIAKYLKTVAKNVLDCKYPDSLAKNKNQTLEEMDDWKLVYHIINEPEYHGGITADMINRDQKDDEVSYQFIMPDHSLRDIPRGSTLEVSRIDSLEKIRMGDYVVVALSDKSHRVRRFMRHYDKVILLADNLSHQSYTLDEKVEIIGKVISVRIKPGVS